ncbi:hypothetical protein [Paenibacillus sp. OK076]|uniref:hypothetical protein n=1 Tax=Paenibacillus sp. OK076 TaxID=1884379 RepID=UPI0008D8652F|nr:hypothetical protein [Paenibacillus sp. OK076]SEP34087.1 hypothetical protein SAMN05518670_6633 [Paenibacillus sp. OK076]
MQFENTHNKLMAACGVILAPLYGTLQSIIGGLTLVLLIAVASSFRFGFQDTKQTALPLAPFLAIGGIAAFFFRIKAIFHFVLKLFFISY